MGRKGTRGFTSNRLGLAPTDEVMRRPELPTVEVCLAERDRRRRMRGYHRYGREPPNEPPRCPIKWTRGAVDTRTVRAKGGFLTSVTCR